MKLSRSLAPLVIAAVVVTGLVACSSAPSAPAAKPSASRAEQPTKAPAAAGDGATATWANPITKPGTLLTSASGTNFTVDIYQVATATASKTGQFVDPKDNKPIIAVGDKIVYVNYVFTNTGNASIPLSYSLGTVEARYADWPYLQGMDSVVDLDQEKQLKVNNSGIAPTSADAPYVWKSGESFSYGENFKYEPNGAITFDVSLIPALDNGDLDHEKKQEIKVNSTIK